MIEEFVSRSFYSRDLTHWEHWRTKSYSQHQALGAFYDDVIDAVDTFVEAYQGRFDLIGPLPIPDEYAGDILQHLKLDCEWIETHRDSIAKGTPALENLLDAVSEIYLRTIYKLERLK